MTARGVVVDYKIVDKFGDFGQDMGVELFHFVTSEFAEHEICGRRFVSDFIPDASADAGFGECGVGHQNLRVRRADGARR